MLYHHGLFQMQTLLCSVDGSHPSSNLNGDNGASTSSSSLSDLGSVLLSGTLGYTPNYGQPEQIMNVFRAELRQFQAVFALLQCGYGLVASRNISCLFLLMRICCHIDMHSAYQSGLIIDRWYGDTGDSVDDLTSWPSFPYNPDSRNIFNNSVFLTPQNLTHNYGETVYGLFRPLESGEYTFYIASDDHGALYLAPGTDSSQKQLIASCPRYVRYYDDNRWYIFPQQKSAPQNLTAGKYYYIEALMKQGGGPSLLTVGVMFPNGTFAGPVPTFPYFFFPGVC